MNHVALLIHLSDVDIAYLRLQPYKHSQTDRNTHCLACLLESNSSIDVGLSQLISWLTMRVGGGCTDNIGHLSSLDDDRMNIPY